MNLSLAKCLAVPSMSLSYMKQYSMLIVKAKADRLTRTAKHLYADHHVFARCQSLAKGKAIDNRQSNLARLTHQEHYEAHRLLTLIYPKNYSLACAFCWVSNQGKADAYDAEAYAQAMILASTALGSRNSEAAARGLHPGQSDENKKRMADYGRSEKSRRAASKHMAMLSNEVKECKHCRIKAKGVGFNKHHGDNCKSLTSYILATSLATGETREFKTMPIAESSLGVSNVAKVVAGKYKHAGGWYFERVALTNE